MITRSPVARAPLQLIKRSSVLTVNIFSPAGRPLKKRFRASADFTCANAFRFLKDLSYGFRSSCNKNHHLKNATFELFKYLTFKYLSPLIANVATLPLSFSDSPASLTSYADNNHAPVLWSLATLKLISANHPGHLQPCTAS